MRAILVRVGVDQTYGGWNAPVDPDSGRFVYVPIPESAKEFHPGCERRYDEVISPLVKFLDHFSVHAGNKFPIEGHRGTAMHLDPDFEHLTYGDEGNKRGSDIKELNRGDLLVFYAGLRPIRPSPYKLLYSIVGLFMVEQVEPATEVVKAKTRLHENAHTRKNPTGVNDIVVRAQPGHSGKCSRCVPIGEFRDRAYRVRRDLLDVWGGLSVNDGFIQRSARPPKFNNAERFIDWWHRQGVQLVRSNFVE